MATITCDKCHYEWPIEQIVFEEVTLDEATATKMRYFQCPECHEEYVVSITDKELRRLIVINKKMRKKYIRMFNNHESAQRLRNCGEKLENIDKEIRTAQRILRDRWERR